MSDEVDLEILLPRQVAVPPVKPPSARNPVGSPSPSPQTSLPPGMPTFMDQSADTGHHHHACNSFASTIQNSRPRSLLSEPYGSQNTPCNPSGLLPSPQPPQSPTNRVGSPVELGSAPSLVRSAPSEHDLPGYQPTGYTPLTKSSTSSRPNMFRRCWRPYYNMYFFLIAGILFAIGHHFFYHTLDRKEATNQIRLLRYGAALSFLSKASLAAAASTAFRQRLWMAVNRQMFTLAAVDSLFAATEDVSALFNLELFKKAKLAILLAIYIWCTPLVVILASETLAVEPMAVTEDALCPSVRSLNFNQEGLHDWRSANFFDSIFRQSLSYWNITTPNAGDMGHPDHFDYYSGPSVTLQNLATQSILRGKVIERENASAEIASPGWNYSNTIEFVAPGYKCTELASGVNSRPKNLGDAVPPFGMDILVPTGNLSYIASAFEGEYVVPQMPVGDGGVPQRPPPYPEHLGALRTEPVIWIGYASVEDPSKRQPNHMGNPLWETAFTPKLLGCEHYETHYEVEFTYNSSIEHIRVKKRQYLRPVIDTVFIRDETTEDGTFDNTTATPRSNYVLPTDTERYRTIAAYHSIGLKLREFLEGTIRLPDSYSNSRVLQTKLLDPRSHFTVSDFPEALMELYEDMLLSLLSNPQLLPVVWAADAERDPGTAKGGEMKYPCVRHRTSNRYRYHVGVLWAVYSVAIILSIMAVIDGTYIVLGEGTMRTTRFTSIAAATRGPALEKVSLAEEPSQARGGDAERVRVGYGYVVSKGDRGFGVEGDVVQLGERKRVFRGYS